MNWRDSIWVQDSVTRRRSRSGQRSVELPMKENARFLGSTAYKNVFIVFFFSLFAIHIVTYQLLDNFFFFFVINK